MKLVTSEELLRTPIFRITRDRAVEPGGFVIERAIVQHAGSAVVMPVDAKQRVLLVRQYRLPARGYLWELPAGRLDPGEKPLAAARRELREETGLRARSWKKLAEFWPSPGFLAEKMTVYLATGLTQGEAAPMDDERIDTRWFTRREIETAITGGRIADAKTLIGYYTWRHGRPEASRTRGQRQ